MDESIFPCAFSDYQAMRRIRNFFEPYVCGMNERRDDQYQLLDGRWTLFTDLLIVFIYNNKVVKLVGYRDITYFSSTFKKLVGISPSEYQDKCV